MPNAPKVLAVCVNWNGEDVLPATLESLRASTYSELSVVVVDNASDDASAVAAEKAEVETIRLDRNLGYGGGINEMVSRYLHRQEDSPTYFLLMNNDVKLEPEAVSQLVAVAEERGPGVYGPKILRETAPGHLEAAWGHVTFSHVLCRFEGKNAEDAERWDQTRRAQLLLGAVLLVHRKVFQEIGLFDVRFFMYHEEVDLLFRLERAGLPAYFCPEARALHAGGHSTRKNPDLKCYWTRKNTVLFLRKHRPGARAWVYWFLTLAGSFAYNLIRFRFGRASAVWRGVRDGWEGWDRWDG